MHELKHGKLVRSDAARPSGGWRVGVRLAAAFWVILSALASASCVEKTNPQPRIAPANDAEPAMPQAVGGDVIFALLADNSLIEVSPETGRVERELSPGHPSARMAVGRYLALSRDGKSLFALGPGRRKEASLLTVIDVSTARVQNRYPLPERVSFRSLAVGPKTGRLYLFGNRPAEAAQGTRDDQGGQDTIVAVLDAGVGKVRRIETIRKAGGRSWIMPWTDVSLDEEYLFVSYHGADTTGADWIEVTSRGLERCRRKAPAGQGCIAGHGNVEAYGDHLLIATGTPQINETTRAGKVVRELDTKLEGNHLMEFAVDTATDRLYAVGSCGYTGGLSRVDLDTGQAKLLAPTRSGLGTPSVRERAVCGESVAAGPESLLVVGKTLMPVPQPDARGSLLLIDGDTGEKIRTVRTPSEPVDVVATGQP